MFFRVLHAKHLNRGGFGFLSEVLITGGIFHVVTITETKTRNILLVEVSENTLHVPSSYISLFDHLTFPRTLGNATCLQVQSDFSR